VETDGDAKLVAKISGIIWPKDFADIKKEFKARGIDFAPVNGMVVGFQCCVQYSPHYGLCLRALSADHAVALGELEFRRREIIGRLQREGLGRGEAQVGASGY
jgi:exodeoxyribonuclease VII large subunit